MSDITSDEMATLVGLVRRWRSTNRDQRFTQWIQNLVGARDPYSVEDDELADLMRAYFDRGSRYEFEVDGRPQDPS